VAAGEWGGGGGQPLVSVATEYGPRAPPPPPLGLKLGDRLTFDVRPANQRGQGCQRRQVQWTGFFQHQICFSGAAALACWKRRRVTLLTKALHLDAGAHAIYEWICEGFSPAFSILDVDALLTPGAGTWMNKDGTGGAICYFLFHT